MPKIQFARLPRGLWLHFLERVQERRISLADLEHLHAWVNSDPHAPEGDWYKDFGSFKVYGTGKHPKTILTREMQPYGEEIDG